MKMREKNLTNSSILCKACIPTLLLVLFCARVHAQEAKGPETLYEMVPHVVLPQSIQYKPMPTSLSRPGAYTAPTNYPATYTAFPSYVLPYPAEMTSIQQAVYPITQVAHQPQPIVFPKPADATAEQQSVLLIIATPTPTVQPERPVLETRPVPALPRAIRKTNPVREIDVYAEEENGFEEIDTNSIGEFPGLTRNISDSIESFVSRKTVPFAARYGMSEITQVQYSTPVYPAPAPFNPGPFANANLNGVANNCAGNGYYYNDPLRVPTPAPDPLGNISPYTAAASTYGVYPQYANPYPYPQGAQAGSIDPSGSSTPGLSPEVLNQIEQLIQKNPNVQFSAVMMGPNGQMIPINNGAPVYGQQAGQGAPSGGTTQQMPQMQQLQSQMQYIQAMNQYVQRVNAARANNQCVHPQSPSNAYPGAGYLGYGQFGGYAPYVQPIPGAQGAYALPNPYYQAMYQSLNSGYAQPNYGYGYGYGPMFNPYLPTPQGYHGMVPSQQNQEKDKTFWERFRERRKKGEKQMCDAWRAPHYPEETGMRMPSKDAYPWGYFGSHTSPLETPNFGGYYGMYYGTNTYPGL